MNYSINSLLQEATKKLEQANITNPRHNAALLLMDLLNCNKTYLIAHDRDILDLETIKKYESMIERRSKGEPPQYISGFQEFYGRQFIVNPSVLIPRPETELIIEKILALTQKQNLPEPEILDVGTGSGCIAITLALEISKAKVTAIDISPSALVTAQQNAIKHQVSSRISWQKSDLVKEISTNSKFHFCCANLPYVPLKDQKDLAKEVCDYEPGLALFADDNGLALIKRLITEVVPLIYSNGYLLCEIGFGQEELLLSCIDSTYWHIEKTLRDLQGIARTIVLQKK